MMNQDEYLAEAHDIGRHATEMDSLGMDDGLGHAAADLSDLEEDDLGNEHVDDLMMMFIRGCNNGCGLNDTDKDRLFEMLHKMKDNPTSASYTSTA